VFRRSESWDSGRLLTQNENCRKEGSGVPGSAAHASASENGIAVDRWRSSMLDIQSRRSRQAVSENRARNVRHHQQRTSARHFRLGQKRGPADLSTRAQDALHVLLH
jgi:hypothetical protein